LVVLEEEIRNGQFVLNKKKTMSIDLTFHSDVRCIFNVGDSELSTGDFLVLFSVVLKDQISSPATTAFLEGQVLPTILLNHMANFLSS
jgi:hypothetical protein